MNIRKKGFGNKGEIREFYESLFCRVDLAAVSRKRISVFTSFFSSLLWSRFCHKIL